jgi:hypothetical protein
LFVNKHIFFTTNSTKICFSLVTHLAYCKKEYIWEALLVTYNMSLHQSFHITVISGDQEFSALNSLAAVLPTAPCLDWAAASQHCGLIKRNIHFLKENICLLCHSLPFTMVPGIMVVCMVLHIIKFVNRFPCQDGVKHFSPGEIMTGHHLHRSDIVLSFGVFYQVAENVQPRNSLAPQMQAAIFGGQFRQPFRWSGFPCIRHRLHNNQTSVGCPTNAARSN